MSKGDSAVCAGGRCEAGVRVSLPCRYLWLATSHLSPRLTYGCVAKDVHGMIVTG